MKKLMNLLLVAVAIVLVFSLSACAVGVTCISHIDRDENEKCDNCGQTIVKSNVKSISIKTEPTKLYFALNEELDVTGGVLSVTYNDGTPDADISFTAEGVSVTKPGMGSVGQKFVAINYGGKSVRYTIEVGLAKFVVSFDLGYQDGTAIPSQTVSINNNAAAPDAPERDGYDFAGWYTSNTFATVFDFEIVPIAANTTVYAKWLKKYTVTYSANYVGGSDLTEYTVNGKAVSTVELAARDNYTFAGWYADADCTVLFNFNADITANITLYAKWVDDIVEMFTVTFNHNYGNIPVTSSTSVPDGSAVAIPASPGRPSVATKGHQASGFVFGGWYTDAACTIEYTFDTAVTSDITLYAKWTGTYIFEAEHVSLTEDGTPTGFPLQGMGASGGSEGPNMVDPPSPGKEGVNASNGYYVTYLYANGLALHFMINSDRDVSDAKLIFRISIENAPIALTSSAMGGETLAGTPLSQYDISLNGKYIEYETIEILDATGHPASGGSRPFSDFTIAVNLPLVKGENVFKFETANDNGLGGTMTGTAPVIDCIKIATSANLSWTPVTGNEFGQ